MASWRAPSSILEAPDSIFEAPRLDFGGSWDDFFEDWGLLAEKMQELISNFKLELRSSSWMGEMPRSGWPAVSPPRGLSMEFSGFSKFCVLDINFTKNFCHGTVVAILLLRRPQWWHPYCILPTCAKPNFPKLKKTKSIEIKLNWIKISFSFRHRYWYCFRCCCFCCCLRRNLAEN